MAMTVQQAWGRQAHCGLFFTNKLTKSDKSKIRSGRCCQFSQQNSDSIGDAFHWRVGPAP